MTLRPAREGQAQRAWARGYTFVELLMSLSILTIGVGGVVAMQKVTVTSNHHAKNLAIATEIGQAWMDALNADAVAWNHPSALQATSDLGSDTIWLSPLASGPTEWILPGYSDTLQFGPGFDALGNPVDMTDEDAVATARFCTHIRLSWLFPDSAPIAGNGVIRAEVRVFWQRDGQAALGGLGVCDPDQVVANVGQATNLYHFVYNVSAIRENTAR